jgi:VWFA-related protein
MARIPTLLLLAVPAALGLHCLAQALPDDTTIKTDVNLVLIDVVVTANGAPVHALPEAQFHIFENGKEQKISSFDEASSTIQSSEAPRPTPAPKLPLPPNVYTDVPDYPASGPANILLLDALNTPAGDQMQMRRQMLDFLRTIPPGAHIAIFTLSSRLRLVQGFTSDPALLLNAIDKKTNPHPSSQLDQAPNQGLNSVAADQSTFGVSSDAAGAMQQFAADQNAYQVDMRVRLTLDAMEQLARYLGAIPGRKNLIWFSGSFPIQLDPDDSLASPFQAARQYSEDMRAASMQLSAARVAVYPVDARGLMTLPMSDAAYSASSNSAAGSTTQKSRRAGTRSTAGGMPQLAKDNLAFMTSTAAEHASMQQIAEDTGGQTYVDSNGLKDAIAHAIANGSNYYTLAYKPTSPKSNGDFRKLEIKVTGGSYSLAYRRGYYPDTPRPLAHTAAVGLVAAATLHGSPAASEIQFQVHVQGASEKASASTIHAGEPPLKGNVTRYLMKFAINPQNLALTADSRGVNHARVELTAIAYDADGKRLNFTDNGFDLKIPASQLAESMRSGLPAHAELDLPPGRVDLRIAVHDLNSNRVGSIEIPIQVPRP